MQVPTLAPPTNHPTSSPSLSVQPPCVCDCAARIVSCYCIHPPSQPAGKAMRGPVQTYLNRGQACGGLSADHQPSCAQHVITSRPLTTHDTRFSISGLATSPAPQTPPSQLTCEEDQSRSEKVSDPPQEPTQRRRIRSGRDGTNVVVVAGGLSACGCCLCRIHAPTEGSNYARPHYRLLLSRTRFRDLPEDAVPTDADDGTVVEEAAGFGRDLRSDVDDPFEKRHRQRMLVSNLAALLSGLKDRNEASMRMPSLRFGK
ncbi:hypothetical protein C0Q70_18331 [Pomacea canaliculata]|uniref:Uncharacterized protein n=1 Tax=Pomacea canaliculata TaxID=400727 RepID=A0A2T7NMV9_POMCA|nr:hypothetical protein C0Q70_18331 [Pomacea canaliculata]